MNGAQAKIDRLALSRERLRQAMRDGTLSKGRASSQHAAGPATAWFDSLNSIPGAGIVIEAVRTWWARHPLRIASLVASDAAGAAVRPLAQSNPIALMLGAMLLGGLFAWSRPWRWILTPALFAGLLPQIVSKAMASVPAQSWMAVLASLTQEQHKQGQEASPKNA